MTTEIHYHQSRVGLHREEECSQNSYFWQYYSSMYQQQQFLEWWFTLQHMHLTPAGASVKHFIECRATSFYLLFTHHWAFGVHIYHRHEQTLYLKTFHSIIYSLN